MIFCLREKAVLFPQSCWIAVCMSADDLSGAVHSHSAEPNADSVCSSVDYIDTGGISF